MKTSQFLEHYGIGINPFSQEDAQADHIFQQHCADTIYHPAWDKILGDCSNPGTAVVFGEKGAGKTALRIQLLNAVADWNAKHCDERAFVISYDDLNPFLDVFRDRLRGRRRQPENCLQEWRLWDHMDALLTLSTRRLCNVVADEHHDDPDLTFRRMKELPRLRKRDLLMLAAFYDRSSDLSHFRRWKRIKWRLGFLTPGTGWRLWLGTAVTILTLGFALRNFPTEGLSTLGALQAWWIRVIVAAGWIPWVRRWLQLWWRSRGIASQVRILEHGTSTLRRILGAFYAREIDGQPMPSRDRSDDRYELMSRLQRILKPLGFTSMVVIVDRVDEPHLINGSPERMRDFLWSMFDNKFLKHPGIGFKMLLPKDVVYYLNREKREFYERSRLDKQNLINSLEWTGESLYDMATNRLRACLHDSADKSVSISSLFADDVTEDQLIERFGQLRVPRHLFRFLFRLLTDHCNASTEDNPVWKISAKMLAGTMDAYHRELDALDRGLGTG
ncbi:MAG: hypothetical protein MK110_06420 [Fuerstiella sp.]|nr:hypothetical protein [Fuerstiella sp.]